MEDKFAVYTFKILFTVILFLLPACTILGFPTSLQICGGTTPDRNCIFAKKWIYMFQESAHVFSVDIEPRYEEMSVDFVTRKLETGTMRVVFSLDGPN